MPFTFAWLLMANYKAFYVDPLMFEIKDLVL
jgi:hypothetical protein